jgi:hypothetical protein
MRLVPLISRVPTIVREIGGPRHRGALLSRLGGGFASSPCVEKVDALRRAAKPIHLSVYESGADAVTSGQG